ncbi:hypothetical protein [Mucilaginibacter sp.]
MLSYLNLYAQKVYKFELEPANTKTKSLYNSIAIVDFRHDTTYMGFVLTGLSDRYSQVSPAVPISKQYQTLLSSVIDSTAGKGKLLLLITRLLFAERENTFPQEGYFNMRANLYAKIANHYQKIRTIDTVVKITSINATKALFKAADDVMADFLVKNLSVEPSGPIYLSYDLLNIFTTEKSETVLYTTFDYANGLYYTYKSFKNQTPDKQIVVDSADINSGAVRTIEGDGVTSKVKTNDVYALVYKGHPYVMSAGHYYPLTKKDNTFFFTGKASYFLFPEDQLVAEIVAGSPKYYFFLNGPTATFEMMLDYKSGAFIRIKKATMVKKQDGK